MAWSSVRWQTWAILSLGIALRVALAIVMPPEVAYDDHFTPIKGIVTEGRLPRPDECWECYQPPLYYVFSAGVFGTSEAIAKANGAPPQAAEATGRRAVQFVSVAAGCLTLLMCWAILRRTLPTAPGVEALALAIVAVLPQHIYMSAMVTNDAMTYLVASLAIWAALRAHAADWHVGWCVAVGVLGGAAVLCKGYGMVTAAILAGLAGIVGLWLLLGSTADAEPAQAQQRQSRSKPAPMRPRTAGAFVWRGFRPLIIIPALVLLVGMWPAVRNLTLYKRLQVDNFDFFPTGMQSQPPGSVAAVDFLTFRGLSLLQHPWIHTSHVDSFWTELYARFWFDYEGFSLTLRRTPQWLARQSEIIRRNGGWNRASWNALLNWQTPDVPADFRRVAIGSYVAGLPLTAMILVGVPLALRRSRRRFGVVLLLLHFFGCLSVPVFQVLRLPYFAAMKAAFALSAVSSVPLLAAVSLSALRGGAQVAVIGLGWAAVASLVVANVGYIVAQYAR